MNDAVVSIPQLDALLENLKNLNDNSCTLNVNTQEVFLGVFGVPTTRIQETDEPPEFPCLLQQLRDLVNGIREHVQEVQARINTL